MFYSDDGSVGNVYGRLVNGRNILLRYNLYFQKIQNPESKNHFLLFQRFQFSLLSTLFVDCLLSIYLMAVLPIYNMNSP